MKLRRWMRDDEQGATVVIVVLSLIALFGMLVLVVDVGGLLWKRRAMVNGADAAALAAAKTCAVSVSQDPSDPIAQANLAASANVPGLTSGNLVLFETYQGICDQFERTDRGYVTVRYSMPQELFFAPVLGFGDSSGVSTEATAAWGALAAGKAVPIVLESSSFQGPCDIPDGVQIGDECSFWYNNGNFAIGEANWGFLDLQQWNVDPGYNCNSAGGAADREDFILYDYPSFLPLNDPGPTYVCSMTGHATSNWQDLLDRLNGGYPGWPGPEILMPVNDCTAQLDKRGNVVQCGQGTPDKFAIIGFTTLELKWVLEGDDDDPNDGTPAAIAYGGAAGDSGSCKNELLGAADAGNYGLGSWSLDTAAAGCGANDTPDSIANVVVKNGKGNNATVFTKCAAPPTAGCDYVYDAANHRIHWYNPLTRNGNKYVSFDWVVDAVPATPGKCGMVESDPNALCLVMTWKGYTTQSGEVGSGENFGPTALELCDFNYDSCPEGLKP